MSSLISKRNGTEREITCKCYLYLRFNLSYEFFRTPPILCLGLSATKFVDESAGSNASITSFLGMRSDTTPSQSSDGSQPRKKFTQMIKKGSIEKFFSPQSKAQSEAQSDQKVQDLSEKDAVCESDRLVDLTDELNEKKEKEDRVSEHDVLSSADGNSSDKKLNKQGFFKSRMSKTFSDNLNDSTNCDNSLQKGINGYQGDKSSVNSTGDVEKGSEICDSVVVNESKACLDSVDPEVLNQLPLEIQQEIGANLKPNSKAVSSCTAFFKSKDVKTISRDSNTCSTQRYNGDAVDNQTCDKCGKDLPVWEIPEHMDFHFAQELQKELRAAEVTERTSESGSSLSTGTKRKLSAGMSQLKGAKKHKGNNQKTKSIASFFCKKS